jgi:hypothetical protein
MKKLLLILLCLPMIGFGQQQTYVPDDNFEQALIDMGFDSALDDSVTTNNINAVTNLAVFQKNISDLTGIECFTDLTTLHCGSNQLTSLDLTSNTDLAWLQCSDNQITILDLSNNINLKYLYCSINQITNLDLSNNINLIDLFCDNNQLNSIDLNNNTHLSDLFVEENQITNLDLSQNDSLTRFNCWSNQLTNLNLSNNTSLEVLYCGYNQLQCLNIANGNNLNLYDCNISNTSLSCIEVDNQSYMTNNWQSHFTSIDPQYYFSNNCNNSCSSITSTIQEHDTNKEMLKVTDLLGRETKGKKNEPLLYLYDDGTVEKRIVIE